MKKWLLAMSALLLTVGLLTGCGSKDKDSDAVKSVTGENKEKDKHKDKDGDEVVVDEHDDQDETEEVIDEDEDKDEEKDEDKDKDKEKAKDEDKKAKSKDKKESNKDNLLMGVDENMVKNVDVVSQQELGESLEFGPLHLDISKVQLSEVEIGEDYVDMFEGKEELSLVTFEMRAENTSDKDVTFYPDQSTMTTSAGEQVETAFLMNDQLGGDFFGEVWKEGTVSFAVDSPVEELEHITLIITPGYDDDYNDLGKQVKLKIELE